MPIRPAVIDTMAAILRETGNPSSIHFHGRQARRHVEDARNAVAALIKTNPSYVFFTSGATESNNIVLRSYDRKRILVSAIEHPSVIEVNRDAEQIPVGSDGIIDLGALEKMLTRGPIPDLVSVMLVNNETGIIQPVAEIVRLVRRVSPMTLVHSDAVQAAGRIEIDFSALQTDFLSLSAHKMGGPQGVGALVCAPGAKIHKLTRGGGQEKRQRPGTENVAAIAGFGVAATLAAEGIGHFQSLGGLRDDLENRLLQLEPRLRVIGRNSPRVANTTQIALPGIAAETQLMALDLAGISVSSGSACSSGTVKPSHVLAAMNIDENVARGAMRVSLGWSSVKEDVDVFVAAWDQMHRRIKDKIAA